MTEPEPAPLFGGLITLTASATVVHPDSADLTEHPRQSSKDDETETQR